MQTPSFLVHFLRLELADAFSAKWRAQAGVMGHLLGWGISSTRRQLRPLPQAVSEHCF